MPAIHQATPNAGNQAASRTFGNTFQMNDQRPQYDQRPQFSGSVHPANLPPPPLQSGHFVPMGQPQMQPGQPPFHPGQGQFHGGQPQYPQNPNPWMMPMGPIPMDPYMHAGQWDNRAPQRQYQPNSPRV